MNNTIAKNKHPDKLSMNEKIKRRRAYNARYEAWVERMWEINPERCKKRGLVLVDSCGMYG